MLAFQGRVFWLQLSSRAAEFPILGFKSRLELDYFFFTSILNNSLCGLEVGVRILIMSAGYKLD